MDFEKFFPTLLALFLTAEFYLSGYTYLDGYYEYYDIGVSELDLSFQEILVHAFSPLLHFLGKKWLLLIIAFGIIGLVFWLLTVRYSISANRIFAISGSIIAIVTLSWSAIISHRVGFNAAKLDFFSLPRLQVLYRHEDGELERIQFTSHDEELLHLTTTKEIVVGIVSYIEGLDRWIVRIPKDESIITRVYGDG